MGGVGVFDKEYQSAPVNCKADRLSAFCASRAKMSAIRTRHDKTTLLVTKGDNGQFRTLRAITYKKILNKPNAILAACLHLLATFGLECWAFACKNKYHLQKSEGGGGGALPVRRLCIYTIYRYIHHIHTVHHTDLSLLYMAYTLYTGIYTTYTLSTTLICLSCIWHIHYIQVYTPYTHCPPH